MEIHLLKSVNPYFTDVLESRKVFEVRNNDRYFRVNDIVIFREYDLISDSYSGRYIVAVITYLLTDFPAMIGDTKSCVFSFEIQYACNRINPL